MKTTLLIALYASAAGFPIIVGGVISAFLQNKEIKHKNELNHFVTAFGGGALLSAIAFVLVPKAIDNFSTLGLVLIFLSGTFCFMGLDILGNKLGGSFAQVLAMMMDFVPEALALGASFAYDRNFGLLIAIFIGLQNLPEGYNSYIELTGRMHRQKALALMFCLSFVGIFAALTGDLFLKNVKIVDGIMLFSAGGILYLIFQDIAPLSRLKNTWIPSTGGSLGFLLGMLGEKLIS